ncbi:MAG: hypothetical protein GY803_25490 [Chloroflexi bacterium]|nr:hypothetical protein [Chloroflexota bacterium]
MEITRDVILDLLPLYLADEVSADTRALVERYLETDPGLARLAEQTPKMAFADDVPVPLTKEDEMEAYLEAKRYMFRRTLVWAGLLTLALFSCLGMALLAFFMLPSG